MTVRTTLSHEMDPNDQLGEKSRQARFTLSGVIASQDPQSAQRTHDSLQKICTIIIDAYRVANDRTRNSADKRNAILTVTTLTPELDWLVIFTQQETSFCKFYPEIHGKQGELMERIVHEVKLLKTDFGVLREEIECFPDIFDNLLHLLENMTEFMKYCHAAEVCRAVDMGKDAQNEAYNLLHLQVKSNFVPQTQLFTQRTKDFQKAASNLVKIQEGANDDLQVRVENADQMMSRAVPDYIIASKEYIVNSTPQLKESQKHAYEDVVCCLDEFQKILERVRVKFINSFDEDAQRGGPTATPIEQAVKDVMQAVAKLRSVPPGTAQAEKSLIQEAVPKTTKAALEEFSKVDATQEEKQELVKCVKQARDGPAAEFFHMQDAISSLADRVQANHQNFTPDTIEFPAETIEETPQDLLQAARNLCDCMRKLSITLDE